MKVKKKSSAFASEKNALGEEAKKVLTTGGKKLQTLEKVFVNDFDL